MTLIQRNKIFILLITIGHFILSFALFLFSFTRSMGRMDSGQNESTLESIAFFLYQALTFPISVLMPYLKGPMLGGLWGYLPFVIVSFLWALLITWVREKKNKVRP